MDWKPQAERIEKGFVLFCISQFGGLLVQPRGYAMDAPGYLADAFRSAYLSFESPMMRPGMLRLYSSRVAK